MSEYVLKVSERQLRLIGRMAELYGRVATGEFEAVAETVRCLSPDDARAARRKLDEAKQLLTGLPERACHRLDSSHVAEDARIAFDLEQALRYGLDGGRIPDRDDPRRHSQAELPAEVECVAAVQSIQVVAA